MSHRSQHIYEFESFRLDVAERLLLRDGEVVPLQPKVFDLLLTLVEHHGHLLEKDELMKLVWPDVIVEEANLATNISILRKTLSENGERLIETVPKRGYRFVASVQEKEIPVAAETKPQAPAVPDISHPIKWMRRRPVLVVSLAVLLLVGVAGAISFWPAKRQPVAPGMAIKSIAVLPPRAVPPSERDESLEMGTTSILITRLGSLRQLIVRPESAVEKYTRPDLDPLAAGREQKVDAVLDSRYQRSGDKIRFTLRLLRVADGAMLWADTFDQQSADLFAVEDALSGKVAAALRPTLGGVEKELLAKRYTSSPEAWQLYVRGRHLLHQRRRQDTEKAIAYLEQAIALDSSFALAHATRGKSYASLSSLENSAAREYGPKAKAAYDQALKLDDQLAEAHSYLAMYKTDTEWDFDGAEQEHLRALALNPNSADVRHEYAFYLTIMRRFDQAIPEARKAERLDPTNQWISRNVGMMLYYAGRYDDAIEQSLRAIELNPSSGPAYIWLIKAYEIKGDAQRAFAARLKQAEVRGDGPPEIAELKKAFATSGLKGCWKRQLDRLLEQEKGGSVSQHSLAVHYARLGEKERALARLQKAVEDHEFFVIALNVEPEWDSYRADPRFVALVRRVGLAP
jgi:DNA-binding winged helix-turn-helix (wHTH) protein/TolB-like protein/Tfp pilus assembly protein PilF